MKINPFAFVIIVSALIAGFLITVVTMKMVGIGNVAQWEWYWVLSPLWVPTFVFIMASIAIVSYRTIAAAFK